MRTLRVLPALALALALTAACRPEDQTTEDIRAEDVRQARENLDPAITAALDAGNDAYRAESYEEALEHYREALELDETIAAAWFGVYMAELALGNDAAADSAMVQARSLAPGASLIHPEANDTTP